MLYLKQIFIFIKFQYFCINSDDKDVEDLSSISETISTHFALLSKGLALAEPDLSIHQALESYLPIG